MSLATSKIINTVKIYSVTVCCFKASKNNKTILSIDRVQSRNLHCISYPAITQWIQVEFPSPYTFNIYIYIHMYVLTYKVYTDLKSPLTYTQWHKETYWIKWKTIFWSQGIVYVCIHSYIYIYIYTHTYIHT